MVIGKMVHKEEIVPAMAATGYAADGIRTYDWLCQQAKLDQRLP